MTNRKALKIIAALASLALLGAAAPAGKPEQGWVVAWGTSQQRPADAKLTNATVRMIARVTIPGDSIKIHLDNPGPKPVTFMKVTVGPRTQGPRLAEGLVKPVTFGGSDSVTLSPGASAESDPVALHVDAQQDIGVSLFVADTDVQPTMHLNASVTNYVTDNGAGDQTASEDGKPFTNKVTMTYWLSSIDVRPNTPTRAIVAFGDSLTDGTCTTLDAHDRWEDFLAERFALQSPVRFSVINEGVGGDTALGKADLTPATDAPHGIDRFEHDVLSQPGVSYLILFAGSNDARRGIAAEKIIGGLKAITAAAHAKGIKVIGVTIVPRHTTVPGIKDTGWSDEKTKIRNDVNAWIRKGEGMTAVLDFDKLMRSSTNPDLYNPEYNCGDGIHPSPTAYFLLGKSVNMNLFK